MPAIKFTGHFQQLALVFLAFTICTIPSSTHGYLPNTNDTSPKYYISEQYRRLIVSCPPGSVYSIEIHLCRQEVSKVDNAYQSPWWPFFVPAAPTNTRNSSPPTPPRASFTSTPSPTAQYSTSTSRRPITSTGWPSWSTTESWNKSTVSGTPTASYSTSAIRPTSMSASNSSSVPGRWQSTTARPSTSFYSRRPATGGVSTRRSTSWPSTTGPWNTSISTVSETSPASYSSTSDSASSSNSSHSSPWGPSFTSTRSPSSLNSTSTSRRPITSINRAPRPTIDSWNISTDSATPTPAYSRSVLPSTSTSYSSAPWRPSFTSTTYPTTSIYSTSTVRRPVTSTSQNSTGISTSWPSWSTTGSWNISTVSTTPTPSNSTSTINSSSVPPRWSWFTSNRSSRRFIRAK